MQKEVFEIRKEVEWLYKCKAECLRDTALNVDKTFKKFFKGNGYPKFKSKKGEQSFHAYQSIKSEGGRIKFYGNKIKYKTSQNYIELLETNRIKQITFKKDLCGGYWATCLIEVPELKRLPRNENVVGIDLGIKDLIITSEGEIFPNNRYLISQQYKLRKLNRKHSKTKKGGKNREKLRVKIARAHRKITRQREHYYHQITNKLIRENQTIVMETLKVQNMVKNHKLARSINDASWGLLRNQLEYKAEWYGRNLVMVDTFYPSSKTCSGCGNVKEELKLSERTYTCQECGLSMDRDLNAAINIRNVGIKTPELTPVEDKKVTSSNEAGINRLKLLTI